MRLTIKVLFILLLSANIFAKVSVIGNYQTYTIYSKNRQTEYYILKPDKKIKLKLPLYSQIYIRALLINPNLKSYYFSIISKRFEKTYKRKVKISKKVYGKKGEKISTLSKIKPASEMLIVKNISDIPILVRVKEKYKNIKFIPISPKKYGKLLTIKVKDTPFTYYYGDIKLNLKGKAYLKIISRTLAKKDYEYEIYDNNKLIKKEKIRYKNSKYSKIASKGNARIYEIPIGKHLIQIKSGKNVIFRFFIDEDSVRLIK